MRKQLYISAALLSAVAAFVPGRRVAHGPRRITSLSAEAAPSLVVVSPPGGVGEVAAVNAATLGSSVRWFVVSDTSAAQVKLTPETLDRISAAGGSVALAGADMASLMVSRNDPASSIPAVSSWCGPADAMICTMDGVPKMTESNEDDTRTWQDALKVAAMEASKSIRGTKVAVLSADDGKSEGGEAGSIGSFVGGLLGGKKQDVPSSLASAMCSSSRSSVLYLRYGELFGTPESSPEFCALVGGPKRIPDVCEEYMTRSVRVDPTLSLAGTNMMGSTTRSSRHAVGQAAALVALEKINASVSGLDVCVSSQAGTDAPDQEVWQREFSRAVTMIQSGKDAQLFVAEFDSVPDTNRLTDWIAMKWAPAVLRTYDIAAIRTGARPVYAMRVPGENRVEVIWQQLVKMETVTVGKMIIQISDTSLEATRGPGDAAKGFGAVSRTPLNGEDVLVRRLAEAVSQAFEKGLASKVILLESVAHFHIPVLDTYF
jgi:hypothetical protein